MCSFETSGFYFFLYVADCVCLYFYFDSTLQLAFVFKVVIVSYIICHQLVWGFGLIEYITCILLKYIFIV